MTVTSKVGMRVLMLHAVLVVLVCPCGTAQSCKYPATDLP